MSRTGAAVIVVLLGIGLVGCGDDDEGATTTVADEHGHGDAPEANPCAEGESGTLPGQTSAAPADGATAVTITAAEYSFVGTESLRAGGEFAITFENAGEELHELVIQHINDDEKRPIQDLLKEDDPSTFATPVVATFACPGAASAVIGADLTATGRYVVLCFIPTGTLPSTAPADFDKGGPPHVFNGMFAEVTVS